MGWNKRRGALVVVLALVLCGSVAARFLKRTPAHRAVRKTAAAPYVHPIVASTPVVHPAPPACRVPDLFGAVAAVRQLGATVGCRDPVATRARIDVLEAQVNGCVARDAELDSEWNLLQTAVLELRACTDCATPHGKHCDRVKELLAEAEKAVR